jgi:hypothetical protein
LSRAIRGGAAERDQAESAFAVILSDLVQRIPGARAAALVDTDGETVDYATRSAPFEIKLAAAHWRIVLRELQGLYGDACALSVRAATRSYVVRSLPQGYALALVLSCGASTAASGRALPVCLHRLSEEACWDAPRPLAWHPVQIQTDPRGRPVATTTGDHPVPLEIMGTVAGGLSRFERGWRVRLGEGEATLIREPSGHYYMDEPLLTPQRAT